jgi:hypothetical protein
MPSQRVGAGQYSQSTSANVEAATISVTLTDGTTHASPITNAVATDFAWIEGFPVLSIAVVNGATNAFTATLEGSLNGTNFVTVAYGQGSNAAYTQAAFTVAGGASTILFLPRDDHLAYVRLNVSAANSNGTTVTIKGRSV